MLDLRFSPPSFRPDGSQSTVILGAAALPDRKLLIVGYFGFVNDIRRRNVVRLNSDGTLDTAFDPGLGTASYPSQVLVQSDGRILVSGLLRPTDEGLRTPLFRLLADGKFDPEFQPKLEPEDPGIAALQEDGKIILNTLKSGLIRLNPDGSRDLAFDTTPSIARLLVLGSMALQPDGRILFGGAFLDSQGRNHRLSRFHPDGRYDGTFSPSISGAVGSIALQPDGKVLFTGQVSDVNGRLNPVLARLHSDGTLDESFHPIIAGENHYGGPLLLLKNGQIVVSGNFTHVDGFPRYHLARLNSDGTVDPNFDAKGGPEGSIEVLLETEDGLFVGGSFDRVQNFARPSLARLYNGKIQSAPYLLTQPESKTDYVGRRAAFFAELRGQQPLAYQWQQNGRDLTGATQAQFIVENMKFTNSGVYVLKITNALGTVASAAATLQVLPAPEFPGSLDVTFYPNPALSRGNPARLAFQADGKVIVTTEQGLVRLWRDGRLDSVLVPDRYVYTYAVQDDQKLLVGENGELFRLSQDGTVDPTFSRVRCQAAGPGFINAVVVQPDKKILVAGQFGRVNDVERLGLARLNPDGSLDGAYNPQATFVSPPVLASLNSWGGAEVSGLALQSDGKLLIRGYGGIKRLQADGTLDSSFEVPWLKTENGQNPYVSQLAVLPDGRILVRGYFPENNNISTRCLLRLYPDGSIDPTFNLEPPIPVWALGIFARQSDGKILLWSALPAPTIVRLHETGRRDLTFWSPTLKGNITGHLSSMVSDLQGQAWMAGNFVEVDGVARPGLARLNGDGPTGTISLSPAPFEGTTFRLSLQTLLGRSYQIEWTDSLNVSQWNVLTTRAGDGMRRTIEDTRGANPFRFYRVRVE